MTRGKLTQVEALEDAHEVVRMLRLMHREDVIRAIRATLPPVKVRAFLAEARMLNGRRDAREAKR